MRRVTQFALIVSLLSAACAPAAPAPSSPTTGGAVQPTEKRSDNQVLRIAQVGLPASLSPEASAANAQVYWLMYDNLVKFDEKLNILPSAAEKWEQPNPTTWRVTLKKGLTFSNGDPLTIDDVEFTTKWVLERKTPQLGQLPALVDAKKVDDNTIDFLTKVQDASTLAGLAYLWIIPKKYYETNGRDGFTAKPIGSGPYELAEYRNGDFARFKLRSTPHPFRKPVATEITVRNLTERTAIIAGLRTGELDLAYGQFTASQLDSMEKDGVKTEKRLANNLAALFPMTEMESRPGPTRDKRVRLALNYAIDKEALAKTFYRGEAQAAGQLGIPSGGMWDPDLKPIPFDPAQAKKLLAEAGYPNGFKLAGGLDFTPQTANADVMQAIQSNLKDVGVETTVTGHELALFLDKFYGRNGQTKGDLFVATYVDPTGFAGATRGNIACDKPASNIWWCNKEFDQYLADGSALVDLNKRTELFRKASRVLRDDVSHIYLLVLPQYMVYTPKVKGFKWASDSFFTFDEVYRID